MIYGHFPRGLGRSLALLLICALLISTAGTAYAQADPGRDLEKIFEPALNLRADGEFEAAVANLREILIAYNDDDEVVKRAYEYLFQVLYFDPDPASDKQLAAAFIEALRRYPDLAPNVAYCPQEVLTNVEVARLQMYGSLQITNPEGAEILLDGEPRGMSPLLLEFVLVGKYDLTMTKDGYKERQEVINIESGSRLSLDVELSKKSKKAWYIAGGAVVVGVIAYLLLKDDDKTEPLPEPPPPPLAR